MMKREFPMATKSAFSDELAQTINDLRQSVQDFGLKWLEAAQMEQHKLSKLSGSDRCKMIKNAVVHPYQSKIEHCRILLELMSEELGPSGKDVCEAKQLELSEIEKTIQDKVIKYSNTIQINI